jgi:Ca2+-binding RTX toxin-like protein
VNGWFGDDHLSDQAGNDVLIGGAGNDFIETWKGGDDVLNGGSGDDEFFFANVNAGQGTVQDFEIGVDIIQLYASKKISNFYELKQHVSQDGDNTYIDLGRYEIVLKDTEARDLSRSDFVFEFD